MYKNMIGLVLSLLLLAACGQGTTEGVVDNAASLGPDVISDPSPPMSAAVAPGDMAMLRTHEASMANQGQDQAFKRYTALHHYITVETPSASMRKVFDAAMSRCQVLNCEMLAANYSDDKMQPPSASLSARLLPASVDTFIAGFDKAVEITQHQRTSEDRTDQVVDTEARLKNLAEFRDSLREMLKNKTAKFKDLIEVQRELANTQSEIDSLQTMRKMLAKETELVALDISFISRQGVTQHGFFAPLTEAFSLAGSILITGLANIFLILVRAIPWLLLAIPAVIFIRRRWAKLKAKQ